MNDENPINYLCEGVFLLKFLSFELAGKEQYGVLCNRGESVLNLYQLSQDEQYDKLPRQLIQGIQQGDAFVQLVDAILGKIENIDGKYLLPINEIKFLSPIPHPHKNIICVGKNYRDHAIEMGSAADIPENIIIFTKAPTTINAHLSDIDSHSELTSALDYEGELALVIGKKGKQIAKEEALHYVFGYTILNDITARDLQKKHKQFFIGKSLDTSCPIGPWIVHHNEISNPNELDIMTKVNGEIRQQSNTQHFIFSIEDIISELSKGMTLEPGDIIATGTPAGVGNGFKPPRFLKTGDRVEITVQSIGTLINVIK
ncbi:fumarylacetoacetate hydrolase family protein [Bacillus ginsengihumi]|uniref:Fumarylacetoacetate hydrolase family protein n=1 Tax=Heyndrickxia ginsengihumi TaxID=363870 RepID=A0A6M0P2S9_9BACI|nr:fumarylacetoacetate hydrolase family protein [Bacillus sp. (in: firmicutes)]NEY18851.1 fumarylacetoacetate hydrolase family protein [Heyndrickxia ginsengihumi]